jgi:hypothetical protein
MGEIQRYQQSQAVVAMEKVKRADLVMEEVPLNGSAGSTRLPLVVLFAVSEGRMVVLVQGFQRRG